MGPSTAFVGLTRVTVSEGKQAIGGKNGEQPVTLEGLTVKEIVAVVWPGTNVTVPEFGLNAAASPIH